MRCNHQMLLYLEIKNKAIAEITQTKPILQVQVFGAVHHTTLFGS